MTLELFLLILICGIGTYLLRWLPLRWQQGGAYERLHPRLRLALAALGPAAIVALLIASLWPSITHGTLSAQLVLTGALAAIALTRALCGGIALPTLGGVLVYGLGQWWLHSV